VSLRSSAFCTIILCLIHKKHGIPG